MSRWIDKDALECDTEWSEYHDGFISYSQLEINTAPSIDLVRCGECRYYRDYDGCFFSTAEVEPDGYCHWGERRTNE